MTRLALILMTALALPAQAAEPEKLTLMLDWFVNPDHGPIIVAQEKGYFRDAGLSVEVIAPSDPNAPSRMAAAGDVDLAITYQPQLHLSRHDGLPLVRVGTLVASPLTCLVVKDDGPVKTLADLKDRKVGFAVAGVQEVMLGAMLAHNGLTPKDVEQVNIGWSISPALMSGQVDGVIGAFRNFELNQMALEGHPGRCFYPEDEGVPAYDELIYVANPELMDRETIGKFLAATERASADIKADPAGSWKLFSSTSAEVQNDLNERAWADTAPLFADHPAALDAPRYEAFEAFLAQQGATKGGLAVGDLAVDVTR